MFIIGYWAMGNKQMFFNHLVPKDSFSDPIDPDHYYLPHDVSPDMMSVIMLIFLVLFIYGLQMLDFVENK